MLGHYKKDFDIQLFIKILFVNIIDNFHKPEY